MRVDRLTGRLNFTVLIGRPSEESRHVPHGRGGQRNAYVIRHADGQEPEHQIAVVPEPKIVMENDQQDDEYDDQRFHDVESRLGSELARPNVGERSRRCKGVRIAKSAIFRSLIPALQQVNATYWKVRIRNARIVAWLSQPGKPGSFARRAFFRRAMTEAQAKGLANNLHEQPGEHVIRVAPAAIAATVNSALRPITSPNKGKPLCRALCRFV